MTDEWLSTELTLALRSYHEQGDMNALIIRLFGLLREYDRRRICARTSEAMRRYQAKGRRMGRLDRCPYGKRPHQDNDTVLVDDHGEQFMIQMLREMADNQFGLRETATRLNKLGFYCRGRPWNHSTIRTILRRHAVPQIARILGGE